jgi:UrcA family protein
MNRFALIAAAAAASLALAAPAAAQDEPAVEVEIGDLDTSTPHGAAELQRRIAAAARRVCGSPGSRTLAAIEHVMTCRDNAMRSARIR